MKQGGYASVLGMPIKGKKSEISYPIASRDEWYSNADYQKTGGKMTTMSPQEFLSKVRPLKIDESSRDNIDDLKRHIKSGRTLDPLAIYPPKGVGSKEDGRHRAHAAMELGIKKVPVLHWHDLEKQ